MMTPQSPAFESKKVFKPHTTQQSFQDLCLLYLGSTKFRRVFVVHSFDQRNMIMSCKGKESVLT